MQAHRPNSSWVQHCSCSRRSLSPAPAADPDSSQSVFETPKYIASLIAAINDGAKSAQAGSLAFIALGIFILATTFSATDEDLLLNHAITISQIGAQIPVVVSFGLAPVVFLGVHLYTLIRFDMVGSNIRRLSQDLRAAVPIEEDRDRCRQLLANVEFVQALMTPRGSVASSPIFAWAAWFAIAGFPVMVLLLVQIGSLRLQHLPVNIVNHICLLSDLGLLVWFFSRQRGRYDESQRRRLGVLLWIWIPVIMVSAIDLLWLHIPGDAAADTVRSNIVNNVELRRQRQQRHSAIETLAATFGDIQPVYKSPRILLAAIFDQPVDLILCGYIHWGCRYLIADYRTLVIKAWDTSRLVELRAGKEATADRIAAIEPVSLRGRVLRFAGLAGSFLYAANLIEADFRGADLAGANLASANLQCANLNNADLSGANLRGAQLSGVRLLTTDLRNTDLSDASLAHANLVGARLKGTRYNSKTSFPVSFDPKLEQMICLDCDSSTPTPANDRIYHPVVCSNHEMF
jgi:Pentapeptide repeats (8 copies)